MPAHLTQSQQFIIDKALADAGFRRRLMADPAAAMRDAGLVVPEGVTFTVLEDTATHIHLVLPPQLDEGELSDGDLDGVAGGRQAAISPWKLFRTRDA